MKNIRVKRVLGYLSVLSETNEKTDKIFLEHYSGFTIELAILVSDYYAVQSIDIQHIN